MPTIIKATDRNRGIHGVAFNFDDMAARASDYLDQVREQAKEILTRAAKEAVAIRAQAESQGHQQAQKQVDDQLNEKIGQQMQTLLPAMRQAIDDIHHARHAWLGHWEKQGVHVAALIAARVIRRELSSTPEITLDLLREALELAGGGGRMRVCLSPTDHAALGEQAQQLVAECSRLAPTEIVADPTIAPGGCRVDTEFGTVDNSIDAQLKRIEEELA